MKQSEPLESRRLFSISAAYYPLDGAGNNADHPEWGAAGTNLLRQAGTAYGDGIASMAGADRPNPRAISNALATQLVDPEPNSRNVSDMVYAWGQFIDHDLDLTLAGGDSAPIIVPADDSLFPAGTPIPFSRSQSDPATGTDTANPRQQPNAITSFLDGSMIYGSDATRALALRTMSGGALKTSAGDLLPFNTDNLPNELHIPGTDPTTLFLAGDIRSNENAELAALQSLFVREHNHWAAQFAADHPEWDDQAIYDHARQRVIAEIQSITYNEFLPAQLGTKAIRKYRGYRARVNPSVAAEFSAAAYRMGHSQVNGNIDFFANGGSESHDPVDFNVSADNPAVLQGGPDFVDSGVDQIMKYLVADNAQELDTGVLKDVTLVDNSGAGEFDVVFGVI
jgi:hypothetical protein